MSKKDIVEIPKECHPYKKTKVKETPALKLYEERHIPISGIKELKEIPHETMLSSI